MKELYEKGVATHLGPESCVAAREGRGEALTGEIAGRAIEPRKSHIWCADAVVNAEGNRVGSVNASCRTTPRGQRPWHARTLIAREPGDPALGRGHGDAVRLGNPTGAIQG